MAHEELHLPVPLVRGELTLEKLRAAAARCTACPLYKTGTQTVFGEGLDTARAVFVGEQPGDAEDKVGRPFVGPAGKLLDRALEDAGIDRKLVYVTNVVNHFKWTQRGTRTRWNGSCRGTSTPATPPPTNSQTSSRSAERLGPATTRRRTRSKISGTTSALEGSRPRQVA